MKAKTIVKQNQSIVKQKQTIVKQSLNKNKL